MGWLTALVGKLEEKVVGKPPATGKGTAGQGEPPPLHQNDGAEPGVCEHCSDQGRTRPATTVWQGTKFDTLLCDEHVKVWRKVAKRPTRAYQGGSSC